MTFDNYMNNIQSETRHSQHHHPQFHSLQPPNQTWIAMDFMKSTPLPSHLIAALSPLPQPKVGHFWGGRQHVKHPSVAITYLINMTSNTS